MKHVKNTVIVILFVVFCVIIVYGLKTWNNDGKKKVAANANQPSTSVQSTDKTTAPTITITSNNLFNENNVTSYIILDDFDMSNAFDYHFIYVRHSFKESDYKKANYALFIQQKEFSN